MVRVNRWIVLNETWTEIAFLPPRRTRSHHRCHLALPIPSQVRQGLEVQIRVAIRRPAWWFVVDQKEDLVFLPQLRPGGPPSQ